VLIATAVAFGFNRFPRFRGLRRRLANPHQMLDKPFGKLPPLIGEFDNSARAADQPGRGLWWARSALPKARCESSELKRLTQS
jgi:hypothetical protein